MPIVSNSFKSSPLKGNRLSVVESYVDHNNNTHTRKYRCPDNWDINARMVAWKPLIEAQLIASEKDDYQQAIEDGRSPTLIVTKHITNIQKLKRLVKAIMRGDDRKVLMALDFIDNLTAPQRQAAINVFTSEQITRIQARLTQLRNNRAELENDTREEL